MDGTECHGKETRDKSPWRFADKRPQPRVTFYRFYRSPGIRGRSGIVFDNAQAVTDVKRARTCTEPHARSQVGGFVYPLSPRPSVTDRSPVPLFLLSMPRQPSPALAPYVNHTVLLPSFVLFRQPVDYLSEAVMRKPVPPRSAHKKKKNGNINDPYKHGIRFESDTSAMLFHSSDITDRFISYGNGNVHA